MLYFLASYGDINQRKPLQEPPCDNGKKTSPNLHSIKFKIGFNDVNSKADYTDCQKDNANLSPMKRDLFSKK
ncbi:hypothetical protein VIS19158_02300 [Vibrio scophthalmi LMG 19158]|uniref:Uncharacterized protein n=1 Tax=Vibrio scophthalmi LMG 19158 TaxID=870967 RepID=F9RTS1_9VIBR|nr:hypothetical protein VIS19158_02300 [Vibrio scophthalmi LMG 19158]